ncbi:MAG: glycosyltransferase [Planctomycetes bacterium]|nr:glycosyltransferase [Planctomycetota bacterium]
MNTADDQVLFAGAWDDGPGYPRPRSLQLGLEAAGFAVAWCREPGLGREKQALAHSPWRLPGVLWRQRAVRRRLVERLRAAVARRRPRCIVVPYPGHAVVEALRAAVDVPVVLDLFLSAYDTVVEDRELVRPGSLAAAWLQRLDTRACAAADLVLLDTPANAAYVAALTGLPATRFGWLPVGDPDAPPLATAPPAGEDGRLQLLFFGTGVPLHGLRVLLDAVAAVPGVVLTLVGGTAADRAHAATRLGSRLQLEPRFVDRERLQRLLQQSQLVAGVFGSSGKAQRVVPFKLVHALAAGRPVLTADTPAVAGWLEGSGALFTSPAGDAVALARQLAALAAAPARVAAAAAAARPAFDRHFAVPCLAQRWRQLLARLDHDRREAVA